MSILSLQQIELDCSPWFGYDQTEKFGEPWDTFIATLDVDGTACAWCDNTCGGELYDNFTDDGHRMAMRWHFMALRLDSGNVIALCEACSEDDGLTYEQTRDARRDEINASCVVCDDKGCRSCVEMA